MKSLCVPDDIHKRIKILSANTGKSIKDLIIESLQILEGKYLNARNKEDR